MSGLRAGVVALVGRPNAGKSTLINRVVGSKIAIVSDKPQTTRNCIRGVVRRPGSEIVLLDTPGIHRPLHRMNQRMMRASFSALDGVDLVALVADSTEQVGAGDRFVLARLAEARAPVFLLLNKIDRLSRAALLPVIGRWAAERSFAEVYPISAATGEGVDALLDGIEARLPEGEPRFAEDDWTDATERFLAGEVVREKVLLHTRDEIPYTTTVLVDSFEETAPGEGMIRIDATIAVERDSQKGILVGRGGAMIKRIGSEARLELERLLGRKVHLALRVEARPGWRDDDRMLDRLGLPR